MPIASDYVVNLDRIYALTSSRFLCQTVGMSLFQLFRWL